MLRVKVNNKILNRFLAKPVFDKNAKILFAEETQITLKILETLKKDNIKFVYLNLPGYKELNYKDDIFPDNQKIHTLAYIQELNKNISECFLFKNKQIITTPKFNRLKDDIVHKLNSTVKKITDVIFYFDNYNLNNFIEYYFNFPFFINKTLMNIIYGGYLAKQLNLSKENVKKILKAFLLMDIGFNLLKPEYKHPAYYYTEQDEKLIKIHTYLSKIVCEKLELLNQELIEWVYYHHERIDGSGYPLGKQEIPFVSQILSLIDLYTTLRYSPKYKNMISPELLYNNFNENIFTKRIIENFKKIMIPYPIGQTVYLSNNKKAVVIENHSINLFLPIVKIIDLDDLNNENPEIIDLFTNQTIKITSYLW